MNASDIRITDTLPIPVTYIDNSFSSTGEGSFGHNNGIIAWNGLVNSDDIITLTFAVSVSLDALGGPITNSAVISDSMEIITRTATVKVIVPVYLPILLKNQ